MPALLNLKQPKITASSSSATSNSTKHSKCTSYFIQQDFNFTDWDNSQNAWYIQNCKIYDTDIAAYVDVINIDWSDPDASKYYDDRWDCHTPEGTYTYHPETCSWTFEEKDEDDWEDS